jgi:hypothetical protein
MSKERQQMDRSRWTELWHKHAAARLVLSWSLTGGTLAGGLLLLSVALAASASSGSAPSTTAILFALGALAGLFHGGVLAYLARDTDRSRLQVLVSEALGAALLLVIVPFAWFAALHIALTPPFWARGAAPRIGVVVSWTVCLSLWAWAAWEGWQAVCRAFLRWPERRVGSLILTGVLAVLVLRFLLEHPVIWGTDVQVKGPGALLLAIGATVWIALPIVLALLHAAHRILGDRLFFRQTTPVDPTNSGTRP